MAILRNAGIVDVDKRAQMVFYRLTCGCILSLLSCIESIAAMVVPAVADGCGSSFFQAISSSRDVTASATG